MEGRDELRKRLREKIKGKRTDTTTDIASQMKKDPQTALLQMGIDDPAMLSMASSAIKRPEAFLQQLKKISAAEEDEEAPPPLPSTKSVEEDEEEAPPPLP